MRPFLTYLVPAYWMVAFAIMAAQAASVPGSVMTDAAVSGQFGLSIMLGLVATLFLWTVLTSLLGANDAPEEHMEVAGIAFGGAVLVLIGGLVVSALSGGGVMAHENPYQLGALAASYAAIVVEQRYVLRSRSAEADDVTITARRMALGAAHTSMLGRLMAGSGRGAK